MSNLFSSAPEDKTGVLLEFRAGVLTQEAKTDWVRPDKRKGMVVIRVNPEGMLSFQWKDRETGNVELDLLLFAGDAEYKLVQESKGRVYLLLFTSSMQHHFFWMQEPSADNDASYVEKINNWIENTPTYEDAVTISKENKSNTSTSSSYATTSSSTPAKTTPTPSKPSVAPTPSPQPSAPKSRFEMFSEALASVSGPPPAKVPQIDLGDVLNTIEVLKTGILEDPTILAKLQAECPSNESGSVVDTLSCPQFRQAIDTLNAVLAQSSPQEALASFGYKMPKKVGKTVLETLMNAIQEEAENNK